MLDEATLSRLKNEMASAEYPGLASAYLFGSEAGGHAHRESDIDLAVLLDPALPGGPDARFELRLRPIGRIEPLLAADLEPWLRRMRQFKLVELRRA